MWEPPFEKSVLNFFKKILYMGIEKEFHGGNDSDGKIGFLKREW